MSFYIRYVIENEEPVRIADDSSSQMGQTSSLDYIPGSSIRGYVITRLAGESDFDRMKTGLFSESVHFLNAYPVSNDCCLIPSPKGFYENKYNQTGESSGFVENVVVNGDFSDGMKRASLGSFCCIKDGTIQYYSVRKGSDLRIKINLKQDEKRNVFRNEYISPGQTFEGYISADNKEIIDRIMSAFEKTIRIGNARTTGLGKCRIIDIQSVEQPAFTRYLPGHDLKQEAYLYLLSNTVMRSESGEYCGLNLLELQRKLGVENLRILYNAASAITVRGFNRNWGTKIPSVTMYEKGSVFHIGFDGILTVDSMRSICADGIGVRKNEGFGQILFLDCYDSIKKKQKGQITDNILSCDTQSLSDDDRRSVRTAARNYYRNYLERLMDSYIVSHPLRKSISSSEIGKYVSMISSTKGDPEKTLRIFGSYFSHAIEKEESNRKQGYKKSYKDIRNG